MANTFLDHTEHRAAGELKWVRQNYKGALMRSLSIFTICLLFLSCSDTPTSNNLKTEDRITLSYTSADTSEARDLALWALAQLVPSESAVSDMLYSINYLRYTFKDSAKVQAVLANRFLPPWTMTSINIKFDGETADLVRSKTYSGWSMIPTQAKPDSIGAPDVMGWSLIWYSQHRNPWRVCEIYAALPGVVSCVPNGITSAGGTFPIITGVADGQMTYLFVHGYIYMPDEQHYFYYQNGKPIYAGSISDGQNPKPSWWQNAKASIDSFYYWGKYK